VSLWSHALLAMPMLQEYIMNGDYACKLLLLVRRSHVRLEK
jgi:hypothetical protein